MRDDRKAERIKQQAKAEYFTRLDLVRECLDAEEAYVEAGRRRDKAYALLKKHMNEAD